MVFKISPNIVEGWIDMVCLMIRRHLDHISYRYSKAMVSIDQLTYN